MKQAKRPSLSISTRVAATAMLAAGLLALAAICHIVLHLSNAVTAGSVEIVALGLGPAAVVAGLMAALRRDGALSVVIGAAIETVGGAVAALIAEAAALLARAFEQLLRAAGRDVQLLNLIIHAIKSRREQLAALLLAHLRAITANIAARVLPAPFFAADILRAA